MINQGGKSSVSYECPATMNTGGFPVYSKSGLARVATPLITYKILLVDDDDMIQRVMPDVMRLALNSLVNGSEYEIISAMNGQGGLDLFIKYSHLIRLIFTDFEMPGMNGPEMASQIRLHEKELRNSQLELGLHY
jgi:CheY-like chemotaxis protein